MTTWQKIKLGTKLTIIGLFVLYVVTLLVMNSAQPKVWYSPFHEKIEAPVWMLLVVSFLTGILVTIITGWMIRGYVLLKKRQQDKTTRALAGEIAEMKRKADMLQTKEVPAATAATGTESSTPSI